MQQTASIDRLLADGLEAHRAGRTGEAETAYRRILALQPLHFDARHMLGVVSRGMGRPGDAVAGISLALTVHPGSPEAYNNLANARADLGQEEAARFCLSRALRLRPAYFEASLTLARLTLRTGDIAKAAEHFTRAAETAPSPAWRFSCLGQALRAQDKSAEASDDFARAAAAEPTLPGVYMNWGEALEASARLSEALAVYRQGLGQSSSIASCLEGIIRILRRTFRLEEAATSLKTAVCLYPASQSALLNLAATLFEIRRLDQAQRWFSAARVLNPEDQIAFMGAFNTALFSCDWDGWEPLREEALSRMRTGSSSFQPFTMLAASGDPAEQLLAARAYSAHIFQDRPTPLWSPEAVYRHGRLRVGYLSADFHTHATAYLIAQLIEIHDRRRFEIIGFSYGPDDGSPMRRRLVEAFDRFHDVQFRSDGEIAGLIRENEIDLLIDLKGYTQFARAGILAHRPAPVQVNYLGYPGTLGSPFHDYLIADEVVIPPEDDRWYTETVIRLAGAYQVNDGKRAISSTAPTRQAEGLPEDAFVFCCFNNNWKIGRGIFDLWMDLLRDLPGSVLWLIHDNHIAAASLRTAARRRGIDPARLIFSPRIPLSGHLARHRLADLFLDTLPYGAHTTASDAIFAGLPILTCAGKSFAGRVTASLLTAIGLPELITPSLESYAATARMLAASPDRLQEIGTRLRSAPGRQTLFDTTRFVRGYEEALLSIKAS